MIRYIISGFLVKIITGFDDALTNIPVLTSFTNTRMGKAAFAIGIFLGIMLAIILALFFSAVLHIIPYYKYIAAGLIFALALAIHFDFFVHKPRLKAEKKILKYRNISAERFIKLLGIGFITSFATALDDVIAYSALFLGGVLVIIPVIIGILTATILELIAILYFSEKIRKLKYKDEIAVAGLFVLGILILCGVI